MMLPRSVGVYVAADWAILTSPIFLRAIYLLRIGKVCVEISCIFKMYNVCTSAKTSNE